MTEGRCHPFVVAVAPPVLNRYGAGMDAPDRTASPDEHPLLAALARAPVGEPWTPEQRAELDQAMVDIRAGRARLVRHEDVPAALEEMHRAEHGG
jgi:hypothetical protein